MDPTLAARLILEMLHRVCDVDYGPVELGGFEGVVEDLPGRTDKWPPGDVFLVARLLADKHQRGVGGPFTEYGLDRVLVERATCAGLCFRRDRAQSPLRIIDVLCVPEQGELSFRPSRRH